MQLCSPKPARCYQCLPWPRLLAAAGDVEGVADGEAEEARAEELAVGEGGEVAVAGGEAVGPVVVADAEAEHGFGLVGEGQGRGAAVAAGGGGDVGEAGAGEDAGAAGVECAAEVEGEGGGGGG